MSLNFLHFFSGEQWIFFWKLKQKHDSELFQEKK